MSGVTERKVKQNKHAGLSHTSLTLLSFSFLFLFFVVVPLLCLPKPACGTNEIGKGLIASLMIASLLAHLQVDCCVQT